MASDIAGAIHLSCEITAQLAKYAAAGKMPAYIAGPRALQAAVFIEIDKLFSMPSTENYMVTMAADYINIQDRKRGGACAIHYPSGTEATTAEKNGMVKFYLHNLIEKEASHGTE